MNLDLNAITDRAALARSIEHGPNALIRALASADDVPLLVAEVEQLRYERQLLGACRRHLDEIADPEGRYTAEAIRTAGDLAQRIVDEIGHSVTDEPALGPEMRDEIKRLRSELATATLNALAREIHEASKAKGFWPTPEPGNGVDIDLNTRPERKPGEVLMLIVTEVAEAMEAIRDGRKLNHQEFLSGGKPVGVPSEMADIIIRVLDACAAWGIDIDEAVRSKVSYNATREWLHGRAR